MMVGSLNLLSIAFAVLFVGLGVDFGIQFSVRYRSERFKNDDLAALVDAGRKFGGAAVARRDGDRGRLPVRSCRPTTRACPNSARSPAPA